LGHLFLKDEGIAEDYAADSVRKKKDLSWKKWAKRFNVYLAEVEKLFWPDMIVLGGGISKRFDNYAKYLKSEAPVKPAALLNEAGIIGAALAVQDAG
ncbi:MAG: ROK family protein, partial [Calditrichaeota bacterium]|nr:ROK family protein [Calditrichota bacterium]